MPKLSPRLGKKSPKSGGVSNKRQLKPKHASQEYKYMYNWQWRQYSINYRKDNPLCQCEECEKRIVPLPSEVVDHIKPHKGDENLFWNSENHQALAKKCHDRKTAAEDGGFGR